MDNDKIFLALTVLIVAITALSVGATAFSWQRPQGNVTYNITFSNVSGPQGIQGPPGTDGTNGIDGINGSQGPQGIQGQQGIQGLPGIDGTNGIDGINGTNGIDGVNGTNGINGTMQDLSGYINVNGTTDGALLATQKFVKGAYTAEDNSQFVIEDSLNAIKAQFGLNAGKPSLLLYSPTSGLGYTDFHGSNNPTGAVTTILVAPQASGRTYTIPDSGTFSSTFAFQGWVTGLGLCYSSGVGCMSVVNGTNGVNGTNAYNITIATNLSALNDVTIASPSVDQVLKYNGNNWVNGAAVSVNGGSGIDYFYTENASDIGGYLNLTKAPDIGAELDETVVCNNNKVLLDTYASQAGGIGGSQIDAGVWTFDIWAYVSNTSNKSKVDIDLYRRDTSNVETLLFSINSGTLSMTSVDLYSITSVQQAFAINSTDRLVAKISGETNRPSNTTIHFVHGGTTHYSHFNTPLVLRHNDLAGLQGGTSAQYYHLTSSELSSVQTMNATIDTRAPTALGNTTIARTGNCPDGQLVMNITTSGVQCAVAASSTNLTPYWLSNGSSTATGNWQLGAYNITFTGGILRLKTDGTVNLWGGADGFVNSNTGFFSNTGFNTDAADTSQALTIANTTDAGYKLRILHNGNLEWGGGSIATDTNLIRGAPGLLHTDYSINISKNLTVGGKIGINTTTPQAMLDVNGNTTLANKHLIIYYNGSGTVIQFQ